MRDSLPAPERDETADHARAVADAQRERHAELLDAVGRLAGGIAHDFNNLLAAITGYAELLDHQLRARPDARSERNDLNEIQLATERGQEFTHRLLSFAQRLPTRVALVEPQQIVRGIERLLKRLAPPNTEFNVSLSSEEGLIDVDRAQMEKALTNVVLNGFDSMREGGSLSISVDWRNVATEGLPPGTIVGHNNIDGPCVEFRVADTGAGMSAEAIRQAFLPFHSSKNSEAMGTGLGLSAVYGIVAKVGGVLVVESAMQIGTTVHILIPRSSMLKEKATNA